MIRNIPALAMIPLVILWFGIGEEAKLFLVAIGVFFPVYVNTFHGIRSVDANLIEMARSYGLSGFALYRDVILPGALPSILVGVRFALGLMWVMLIVAETISAQSGIGYMTMNAREFLQTDVVVVGILLYALLGKLADMLAKGIERVTLRWHPAYQTEGRSDERDHFLGAIAGIAGDDLEAELRRAPAEVADVTGEAPSHGRTRTVGDRQAAPLGREAARADDADFAVELRNVDKRYGERHVLSNFDFVDRARQFRVDRRTQRLREVDAAAAGRGSGSGERRHARSPIRTRRPARCRPASCSRTRDSCRGRPCCRT